MRYLRLFEDVNYYVEISPGEFNDVRIQLTVLIFPNL
jgi:hypothetical protein